MENNNKIQQIDSSIDKIQQIDSSIDKIQQIDPLIDKIINDNLIESDYFINIPDILKISNKIQNTDDNFYNQFKPIDSILIKPLIKYSYIVMKQFGYKSDIIGFLALFSFCIALFYSYNCKDIITWIFLFCSLLISFFDKLYLNKLSAKLRQKEFLIVLIKITIHIIMSIILKIFILNNNNNKLIKNYILLLIFMLILIIILIHHTDKILLKENIKSKKIQWIKQINSTILFISIIYIIYLSYGNKFNILNLIN